MGGRSAVGDMADLFESLTVGAWTLPNRLVMAPLTRNRAEGTVPGDLAVEYYSQRASSGLIITEGSQPTAEGQGYLNTPGFHTEEQLAGWRRVADGVHANGGRIVAQLMHVGRISHPDNTGGEEIIAPSPVAAPDEMFTANGMKPYPTPREITVEEIPSIVEGYVQAARNAIEAGLDGVEVHGANGYLIHQFLAPGSNHRTDQYGGSPKNRVRFALEVTRAVADAIGADRVGIRISPAHNIQGATEENPVDVAATYRLLVAGLAPLGLAYLSILADPKQDLSKSCAAPSAASSSPTTASARSPRASRRRRSWTRASPTQSPSGDPSWPTRTCPPGGAPARSSTSRTPTPSTAVAPRATPTTRSSTVDLTRAELPTFAPT